MTDQKTDSQKTADTSKPEPLADAKLDGVSGGRMKQDVKPKG